MKKGGSENMDMAISEPRSNDAPLTGDHRRALRDLDCCTGTNRENASVVYEDRRILDWGSVGET